MTTEIYLILATIAQLLLSLFLMLSYCALCRGWKKLNQERDRQHAAALKLHRERIL